MDPQPPPSRPDPFAGHFRSDADDGAAAAAGPAAEPDGAPGDAAAARGRRLPRWVTASIAPAAVGAAVALGVAALAGGGGGGTTTVTVQAEGTLPPAETVPAETGGQDGASADDLPTPAGSRTVAQIVRDVSPAVTLVVTGSRASGGALGTGFLVDRTGHLLTNAHVVDDAKSVTVTFPDGTEETARVLGRDEATDLAVLKVPRVPAGVSPVRLGSVRSLQVGDPLVAIGNPLGLEQSVSTGIVSALKRTITSPNETTIQNVIQTDAAINQGNSGGPLLDRRGFVVGMNSQIATEGGGNDGIGFATPVDTLRPVADSIIATGSPKHAWIGIVGVTITPRIAGANGLGDRRGVMVVEVDGRGPAKRNGIRGASSGTGTGPNEVPKGGDVIVAVDGRPVRDMGDVSLAIASKRVGQDAEVTILRDGRERTVTVTVQDRPASIR